MAKRFTDTEIWNEDWFLDMPNEYKLFWFYMLSECNHAGIFRVNLRKFCGLNGVKLTPEKALEFFNAGKSRIRIVSENTWLIEDFFVFQYGSSLNRGNRVHKSIESAYNQHDIDLRSIRGLKVVIEGSKRGQLEDTDGVKDKDKDKDINTLSSLGKVEEENSKGTVVQEDEDVDEAYLNSTALVPKMIATLKQHFPKYPIDLDLDSRACLSIAYKIAKQNGWKKASVVNGHMDDCLREWKAIVEFSKDDKWYSTRSVTDMNNEFQRLIQSKNNQNGKTQQRTNEDRHRTGAKSEQRVNSIINFGLANKTSDY